MGVSEYTPATDDLTCSPETLQGLGLHPDEAGFLAESLRTTLRSAIRGKGGRVITAPEINTRGIVVRLAGERGDTRWINLIGRPGEDNGVTLIQGSFRISPDCTRARR